MQRELNQFVQHTSPWLNSAAAEPLGRNKLATTSSPRASLLTIFHTALHVMWTRPVHSDVANRVKWIEINFLCMWRHFVSLTEATGTGLLLDSCFPDVPQLARNSRLRTVVQWFTDCHNEWALSWLACLFLLGFFLAKIAKEVFFCHNFNIFMVLLSAMYTFWPASRVVKLAPADLGGCFRIVFLEKWPCFFNM